MSTSEDELSVPPPVQPPAPPELDFEDFQRIYGPIRALSPTEAAALFDGAPFRWWVAGGWSVELGAEPRRFHEDLEVALPRRDVPAIREWLRDFHLWDTHEAGLRYLDADVVVPIDHEQLWVRRDAYSPWLMDLIVEPRIARRNVACASAEPLEPGMARWLGQLDGRT